MGQLWGTYGAAMGQAWGTYGAAPQAQFETPYVVRLHNFHQLAAPQPCFTFRHPKPGGGATSGLVGGGAGLPGGASGGGGASCGHFRWAWLKGVALLKGRRQKGIAVLGDPKSAPQRAPNA